METEKGTQKTNDEEATQAADGIAVVRAATNTMGFSLDFSFVFLSDEESGTYRVLASARMSLPHEVAYSSA